MPYQEVWRSIPHFGRFAASDLGYVKRIEDGKILAQTLAKGQRTVQLGMRNIRTCVVIAMTFHGEKPSKNHFVIHKNGNRTDNRASNLMWTTYSEWQRLRIDK